LKTDPATIPKADLNTVSAYELRQKAGITDAVARAIVLYRQQYGPYKSVEDLKKIVFINDSLFQTILPFVKVD
jgi:competence protein ComEA